MNPEAGSKPEFATLIGVLTAEVSIKNVKGFLSFLGDRLGYYVAINGESMEANQLPNAQVSDLQQFSAISEQLPSEEPVKISNLYLGTMNNRCD